MLTKKDLQEIGKLIDSKLKDGFSQFFFDVLTPYFDRFHKDNQKEHQELKESIEKVGQDVYEMKDYIDDHETRIRKLEKAVVTS